MRATVQFNAIACKDAEYAGTASVTAGFPDVIDGLAGLVHLHHRLLPVFPQTGLDGFRLGGSGLEGPGLPAAKDCGLR